MSNPSIDFNRHDINEPDYQSLWQELMGVPFRQDFVKAGSVRTRFLETGEANKPAIIFLHGFMSHADIFIRNLPAHGEHFHTFAIDLIGMGFSDKPDYPYHAPVVAKQVADFMDAMGLKSASLAGTSFGSRVAARFAIDYPDRLEKLTLMSPAGLRFDPKRGARLIKNHLEDNDEGTWEGASAAIRLIINEPYVIEDLIAARRKVYSQTGIHDTDKNLAVHHLPETAHLSIVDENGYRSIKSQTLIVKGVADSLTDLSLAKEITELVPNSRLKIVEDSIHAPYFEKPGEFNEFHIDFLKNGL